MRGVVLLGISIEVAIAGACHPLLIDAVAQRDIDALGDCRLQILILAGLPRVVFHDILSRRF